MSEQEQEHPFGKEHYQLAVEASGIGLWDWDVQQDRHVWSRRCREIFGRSPTEEITLERLTSFLPEEDREEFARYLEEIFQKRGDPYLQYRIIWPDQSIHWVGIRGHGTYDEAGRPLRLMGVVFDITREMEAEARREAAHIEIQSMLRSELERLFLSEHEARVQAESATRYNQELAHELERKRLFLQTVVDQSPLGMIIAELPSQAIVLCNAAATALMGYDLRPGEKYTAYQRPGFGAIHPDGSFYRPEEYPLARALMHGEVIEQEEGCYLRPDGTRVQLLVNARPIFDANGEAIAAISIFYDISERYELERRKDAFISMASHELRTPLTTMKGNLQLAQRRLQRLLAQDALSSEQEHASCEDVAQRVSRTLQQIDVQNRLIGDLLDASRIQMDKLNLSFEPCNLVSILCEVVEDVQTAVPDRQIHAEISEHELPVLADVVRIGQVIHNYLTNALKYSPESEPVEVGVSSQEGMARVWVRDAGPGLSPLAQEEIWQRFYQVGSVSRSKSVDGGGLGLGLYISRALIEEHGGEVGVISAPDQGSTFWFTLPLVKGASSRFEHTPEAGLAP